jgi:putative membrane protein
MTVVFRLVFRAVLTWALEAAALYFMLRYLPGVTVVNGMAAGAAILAIGLLSALIRPAILFGAANLGVVPFLTIALPLNAVLIVVAGRIVPGFAVDGLVTAFLLAVGLATANAVLTAMLSVNDDPFLHGDNADIPAFYWYEKGERRLMSSANPRDLHAV